MTVYFDVFVIKNYYPNKQQIYEKTDTYYRKKLKSYERKNPFRAESGQGVVETSDFIVRINAQIYNYFVT